MFPDNEADGVSDRGMKLKTVRKLVFALFGAAVVLALILSGTKGVATIVLSSLALALIIAACVIAFRFSRCPHCEGALRPFDRWKYCPHCGKKLKEQ